VVVLACATPEAAQARLLDEIAMRLKSRRLPKRKAESHRRPTTVGLDQF
jgi:hypothetical protein